MTTSSRKPKNSSPRHNPPAAPRPEPPALPRRFEASAPDIRVRYGPAGRETLSAIAEEVVAAVQGARDAVLAAKQAPESAPESGGDRHTQNYEKKTPERRKQAPKAPPRPGSAPDISLGHDSVGQETMAAIARELVAEPGTGVRARMNTLGFEERPERPPLESGPELAKQPKPAGRDTLSALERELEDKLGSGAPESGTVASVEAGLEVFEMATFVVRGPELARLSSQEARRDFVAERLLHRLPVSSIDDVDRVDVTPWTVRGTVIVRVWCRVPPS